MPHVSIDMIAELMATQGVRVMAQTEASDVLQRVMNIPAEEAHRLVPAFVYRPCRPDPSCAPLTLLPWLCAALTVAILQPQGGRDDRDPRARLLPLYASGGEHGRAGESHVRYLWLPPRWPHEPRRCALLAPVLERLLQVPHESAGA